MRIIRAAECRRMPWKNGGGETTEIATWPEGAGLDEFDWRLSSARVAQDGLFSDFPGVDRTLALVGGGALRLVRGKTGVTLDVSTPPYRFAADSPTVGQLIGGPVVDLNMMTRRGRADHRMWRTSVQGATTLSGAGAPTLLFCADGEIALGPDRLAFGDCAVFCGPVAADGDGTALLVDVLASVPGERFV